MLDIFSGLRLVVKRRSINIDNAIFRCHWFFTSTLLVSFSLIITARQYVGQPIECHSVDKIPDSLLNSYCWVQSTFTVPQACAANQHKWEVPYPCIDNTRGREIKMYAYYQWVGIVLFVQGLMFHLPYYLWKLWENGLIKAITGGLRVAVLNEHERAKKKEIVVEYIHDHLGCHKRYALKYFLCEFICLINLLGQLWATNRFFDGQFLRYGLEVLEYSSLSLMSASDDAQPLPAPTATSIGQQQQQQMATNENQNQQHNQYNHNHNPYLGNLDNLNLNKIINNSSTTRFVTHNSNKQQVVSTVDPMTYIFPRMTKCSYFDFGSSGDVQKHDALCLLPLNIINEKIYIALWFWFLILAILTILVIVYRMCAIASEAVRCKSLISRCKLSSERDIRLICRHCDVGDWFLFYMVAENLDPLIMREIIASIASKISDHLELKRELKVQLLAEQQELHEKFERERSRPPAVMLAPGQLTATEQAAGRPLPPPLPSAPPHLNLNLGPAQTPPPSSSWQVSALGSISDHRAAQAPPAPPPWLAPFAIKTKKRLYNKRHWSTDLGSAELRQQLFGVPAAASSSQQSHSADRTPPPPQSATGNAHHGPFAAISGCFASAPPASEMPLGAMSAAPRRLSLFRALTQRRGSLTSSASSDSSSTRLHGPPRDWPDLSQSGAA